jgi:hypothetical protein
MEQQENPDLQNALQRIAALADEVQQLRRLNATFGDQYENRFHEQIFTLQMDVSRLQYQVNELRDEVKHKEELAEKVVAELHKLQAQSRNALLARPDWLREHHHSDPGLGFVLMPYRPAWFETVLAVINDSLRGHGLKCQTAKNMSGGVIMADVWKGICSCRLVVADLTGNNPNVAYETALADLLGKPVAVLCQKPHEHDLAFDFAGRRLVLYDLADLPKLSADLGRWVGDIG